MMPTWLLLIMLAAPDALPAERLTLDCRLQTGAGWNTNPGDVSAIRCVGVDGFFVPSPTYRLFRRPEESEAYRLIDEELRLAKAELNERTLEAKAAGRRKGSHMKVDFDQALLDGLYQRICLVTGREWSPEAEAQWRMFSLPLLRCRPLPAR